MNTPTFTRDRLKRKPLPKVPSNELTIIGIEDHRATTSDMKTGEAPILNQNGAEERVTGPVEAAVMPSAIRHEKEADEERN